ncbi:MAG TPA: MFS transporter [Bryobacterales bacterium]|jgi:MFS family permease|nr:MFS transporter [Bryobacterales bacterium]
MLSFRQLLRQNRNYRLIWMGQVVSEIGDHFNNIAVFSLALESTRSPMVVSGIMISRAIPAILAGPLAGVLLDRADRKRVMIASDVVRAVMALGFLLYHPGGSSWLLYLFSGLLMLASPFFTSGRSSILPTITNAEELHTANALTQTTQWATLTAGTLLAGGIVTRFGFSRAFLFNAFSFVISATAISLLRLEKGEFRARRALTEADVVRPWREYVEGLRYMRSVPLVFGISLIGVGWATGGGAAQILFSVFGELVFQRGPAGIGMIWGFAGIGLLIGGFWAHQMAKRLTFEGYKKTILVCFLLHGAFYVVFSQMRVFTYALLAILFSRLVIAISSVLNFSRLLHTVPDQFRGRVFATVETMVWSTMMISMMLAGIGSQYYSPRTIGTIAGVLSSSTGVFWAWAHFTGRLPEPAEQGVADEEVEIHGEAVV